MRFSSPCAKDGLLLLATLSLALPYHAAASSPDSRDSEPEPCTIHSSLTGSFYDVRPLILKEEGTKTQSATNVSYHSRGYDYGTNFTVNICAPVVEEVDEVYGISRRQWDGVAAFYKDPHDDMIYSIGQINEELTMRGRKLLLNYTGGSPCPDLDEYGDPLPDDKDFGKRKLLHGEENGVSEGNSSQIQGPSSNSSEYGTYRLSNRRKSTLLSFICDTSPLLSTTPRISFLGSPDHCSYIFEVRSRYACAGATPSHEKGTLGPGGVFFMILGIGVLAYLVGGVVYQRNVMHQRGWRQLPNYSLWAGIFSFISVKNPPPSSPVNPPTSESFFPPNSPLTRSRTYSKSSSARV